jgi:hypothetical protein
MLAGTMLSVIPMIIVYLLLNQYSISGMINGPVKGWHRLNLASMVTRAQMVQILYNL